jgi:hydrogenase nickel incorporation protein HypA/HybF
MLREDMHEVSIVEGLIDIIRATAEQHGLTRIDKISLRIGTMRQIVPDALQFAFEIVGKGTVAEGAAIVITEISTRARCRKCGSEFTVEDYCFFCNLCGSGDVEVTEGKELYIDTLEGT